MKRRKAGYLLCLLCILWINVLYIDYSAFMLLVLFVAVPMISLVYMRIAWILSDVKLITKDMCRPGENIKISVKNKNSMSKILNRHINAEVSISFLKKKVQYNIINDKDITIIDIVPEHAGYMKVLIKSLVIYDFFMIFKSTKRIKKHKNIVVMPELAYASDNKREQLSYDYGNEGEEYEFSYEPEDNTEVIDLRQYRPGDAINHIHWNLSTAGDNYIVRQYGSPVSCENIIVADIIPVNNEKDRFVLDDIYKALYSAGNVFVEHGLSATYAVWDEVAQQVCMYSFSNAESLQEAVCELMKVQGCIDGMQKVIENIRQSDYKAEQKMVVISTQQTVMHGGSQTADDYEVYGQKLTYPDEYIIYNINNTNITDMLDDMYDYLEEM